jgi:hypothetical protein
MNTQQNAHSVATCIRVQHPYHQAVVVNAFVGSFVVVTNLPSDSVIAVILSMGLQECCNTAINGDTTVILFDS